MNEGLKKEKLELGKLSTVSGGSLVDVDFNGICCKPGSFKVLENKKNEWQQNGNQEKCKYCWHLKFDNSFFCDV